MRFMPNVWRVSAPKGRPHDPASVHTGSGCAPRADGGNGFSGPKGRGGGISHRLRDRRRARLVIADGPAGVVTLESLVNPPHSSPATQTPQGEKIGPQAPGPPSTGSKGKIERSLSELNGSYSPTASPKSSRRAKAASWTESVGQPKAHINQSLLKTWPGHSPSIVTATPFAR